MTYVHVSDNCYRADIEMREFVRQHSQCIAYVRGIARLVVFKNGDNVYFVARSQYPRWCLGRVYGFLNDKTMQLYNGMYPTNMSLWEWHLKHYIIGRRGSGN